MEGPRGAPDIFVSCHNDNQAYAQYLIEFVWSVLEPGGCTAFDRAFNSNVLTHPARRAGRGLRTSRASALATPSGDRPVAPPRCAFHHTSSPLRPAAATLPGPASPAPLAPAPSLRSCSNHLDLGSSSPRATSSKAAGLAAPLAATGEGSGGRPGARGLRPGHGPSASRPLVWLGAIGRRRAAETASGPATAKVKFRRSCRRVQALRSGHQFVCVKVDWGGGVCTDVSMWSRPTWVIINTSHHRRMRIRGAEGLLGSRTGGPVTSHYNNPL